MATKLLLKPNAPPALASTIACAIPLPSSPPMPAIMVPNSLSPATICDCVDLLNLSKEPDKILVSVTRLFVKALSSSVLTPNACANFCCVFIVCCVSFAI